MLNDQQKKAVECYDFPALVLAGAGSGKTTVLIEKIKYLIDVKGLHPSNVLALTFSNKAAAEMKERANTNIKHKDVDIMELSTFHSFGLHLLKRESGKSEYSPSGFKVYTPNDVLSVLKEIIRTFGWQYTNSTKDQYVNVKSVMGHISFLKNEFVSSKDFIDETPSTDYQDWDKVLAFIEKLEDQYLMKLHKIYQKYEERMKEYIAMDFDDLIYNTAKLLLENQSVLEKYRKKYQYLLIDEYQDVNKVQYIIAHLLAKKTNKITVVGDDFQSIYAFRGSDIRNILDFDKDFPNTQVIKLEQNYRSTKKIIKAANQIIENNVNQKNKKLFTENENGENIVVVPAKNEFDEAEFIAEEIQKLNKVHNIPLNEITVLYRNNRKSALIENALNNYAIPNKVVSGMSFFDRREILDIVYYLKFLLNPNDPIYLREVINIPKRGIGDATVDKIIKAAAENSVLNILSDTSQLKRINQKTKSGLKEFHQLINKHNEMLSNKPLSDVVLSLVDELDLTNTHYFKEEMKKRYDRKENIEQLIVFIKEKEKVIKNLTLSAFLDEITLDPVEEDEEGNYVSLMTIHASKGLEFPVVFITGMNEGSFPNPRAEGEFELEEERRVCYVAFTRAKNKLYLTYPTKVYERKYSSFREPVDAQKSIYLDEFDKSITTTIRRVQNRY